MTTPPTHPPLTLVSEEAPTPEQIRAALERAQQAVAEVIKGQAQTTRLLLATLLARGHALIEDVPGVGKTTLARALARVLGFRFSRIQFTADLLPGDVIGVQVLDPASGEFVFRHGPLFAELVLADEINRASPKTQSAMLEAMAERQVTVDERCYALPEQFAVLATQNPVEHHGAYPLPESQLDRFMVRVQLGYPSRHEERALLQAPMQPTRRAAALEPVLSPGGLTQIQSQVEAVTLADPVADYLLALVQATREHPEVLLGASPRCSLQYAALARAWAFVQGRDHVLPDDVKTLAPAVLGHRLTTSTAIQGDGAAASTRVVREILSRTPVPR